MGDNSTAVRVAIVGVGNCASSLVQGVHYYKDTPADSTVPGLMHVQFGKYHVRDVQFVAAFDVDAKKVGFDLSEAINNSENCTIKIADVPPTDVIVQRGPTLDGLGKYYKETVEEADAQPVDVVQALKDAQVDVLVSYLPVGSDEADKFYAQCAIDAAWPSSTRCPSSSPPTRSGPRSSSTPRPDRGRRHQEPGGRHHHPPRDGPPVRGPRRGARPHHAAQRRRQHGLQEHARTRAPRVQEGLQDPGRHQQPQRLAGARSTTRTSTSARRTTWAGSTTASGPTCASKAAPSATCR
ncbi:hypothetical protein GCM10023353_00230 [Tomitella cavernea]|uniref:Inositol-3-phosphate synthase n=1 Tax=Tomitella cavernea TaxID=1387982 RepID=A0ABP9BZE1_9ACTN